MSLDDMQGRRPEGMFDLSPQDDSTTWQRRRCKAAPAIRMQSMSHSTGELGHGIGCEGHKKTGGRMIPQT
jgi:hypothetical protein